MSDRSDYMAREFAPPEPPGKGCVVVIVLLVLAAWELVRWWLA